MRRQVKCVARRANGLRGCILRAGYEALMTTLAAPSDGPVSRCPCLVLHDRSEWTGAPAGWDEQRQPCMLPDSHPKMRRCAHHQAIWRDVLPATEREKLAL